MKPAPTRRPTPLQGGAILLIGSVVLLFGLRDATSVWDNSAAPMPLGALVVMFVGATLFAVGGMMLLVAVVRPLFEKRRVDEEVERLRNPHA